MPFYIRKSVNIGPFRFNLSGSGIGVSAGVRGFRIGTGPRGHYIHAGTDGFYYRSSLASHTPHRTRTSQLPTARLPGVGPHLPVETGNIAEMVDADAATILKSINENFAKVGLWPIPLLGLLPLIPLPGAGPPFAVLAVSIALILIGLIFWLYRRDNTRFTTVLMYDLDDAALRVFEKFTTEFDDLSRSQKVINIDTKGIIYDWKRHAGAAFEINSGPAKFGYGTPRRIQTNVSIPFISGGINTVYFFPDLLVVRQNRSIGGLDYRNVSVEFHDQRFHEPKHVPGDAVVVGHTWRFVRRDGGPDRRFNNNFQIPIVNYQAMMLNGPGNFQKVLYISKNVSRMGFVNARSWTSSRQSQTNSIGGAPSLAAATDSSPDLNMK
jgi:hypothetical protein